MAAITEAIFLQATAIFYSNYGAHFLENKITGGEVLAPLEVTYAAMPDSDFLEKDPFELLE